MMARCRTTQQCQIYHERAAKGGSEWDVPRRSEAYRTPCHASGTDNAPVVNFVDYATAVHNAANQLTYGSPTPFVA